MFDYLYITDEDDKFYVAMKKPERSINFFLETAETLLRKKGAHKQITITEFKAENQNAIT